MRRKWLGPGLIVVAACLPGVVHSTSWSPQPSPANDVIIAFNASDGTALEAKLTLPAGAPGVVPVVFYLHGAGPRNYDHPVRYRAADGEIRSTNYYDYYARELAALGVGFFRISKRGCTIGKDGRSAVDRPVFSRATPGVLLDDYTRALEIMRARKEVDPSRIVLFGSSEGTRLAPQLALRAPRGIVGLVLTAYAADNMRDTVTWQNTVGPWRNVRRLIPEAADGQISRAEYDAAVSRNKALTTALPFAAIDRNKDDVITEAELSAITGLRLRTLLDAVNGRNDELLWAQLMNLTSSYLLEDWEGPPTSSYLLKLDLPITIHHGALDGTTRVEGVEETVAALRKAGRTNLTSRIYPGHDHDLGWTPENAQRGGPEPLRDALNAAASMAKR